MPSNPLTIDARKLPCSRCGAGFEAPPDANGFYAECFVLKDVVGNIRTKPKSPERSERVHKERITDARAWVSAGRPPVRPFVERIAAEFAARNHPPDSGPAQSKSPPHS